MIPMTRWFTLALAAVVLAFAALFAACSDDDQSGPSQEQQSEQSAAQQQAQESSQAQQSDQPDDEAEPLVVVVSTQIIADWVRQIGGDHVEVTSLVPAGADVHTLELGVGDVRAIAGADLVIINGATLEASYEEVIFENAADVLVLTEAIEAAGLELLPFSGHAEDTHDDHDDHGHMQEDEHDDHGHEQEDEHDHEQEEHEDHAADPTGRLLIADAAEAALSVVDLWTEEVNFGAFAVAAVNATVHPSPTHRYGIVLARGPDDDDDRVHIFDGGVFLVEHGDHHDLFRKQVERHSLEIVEEAPIHYVNSHGWTAIFADASGHVILINEHDLANSTGDYEPIVLEAGPQHGAALVMTDDHVVVTTKNPDDPDDVLPVGVEVWDFDGHVVYDDSNASCPGMHGEAHSSHGAAFGCIGGVLFLHAHDGEYEHLWVPNPPEMHEAARIGSLYGHHHLDHFFGSASYRGEDGWNSDGIWLIDAAEGTMERVFEDATLRAVVGDHGETLYLLGADAVLYALDAHDGDLIASHEMVGASEAGTPGMIAVGHNLFITDPSDGHVLMVDGHSLEVIEEWHVGGAPSSLAFVGVLDPDAAPSVGHDDHDEDMHENEDDHGHDHDEEEHDDHDDHDEDMHEDEDGHDHGHDHGDEDPHFWFNPDFASVAVTAIADRIKAERPSAASAIDENLDDYLAEIADADAEVRELLADIPDAHRLLVTFHDAFGYFADRYGLIVAGFVVEGPEQGVSAEAIAELIELIEHEGVETVFHEPQFDSNIIDTVADETGVNRGIIWSQPTPDQPTYIGILIGNAEAIANQ